MRAAAVLAPELSKDSILWTVLLWIDLLAVESLREASVCLSLHGVDLQRALFSLLEWVSSRIVVGPHTGAVFFLSTATVFILGGLPWKMELR